MPRDLNYLKDLYRLKQMAKDAESKIDVSELEQEFMVYSEYSGKKTLTVTKPKFYPVRGEEQKHLEDVLTSRSIKPAVMPGVIDISGSFPGNENENLMIFLSMRQMEADHISPLKSYLNPLIEKLYVEDANLIKDFGINEALSGEVVARRGELLLKEIPLFPEKFAKGKYTLSVRLDTTSGSIAKFKTLLELLDKLKQNPRDGMLDGKRLEKAISTATYLRQIMGSLSRYEELESPAVDVATDSCVLKDKDSLQFYLYNPLKNTNVLVYFGRSPFEQSISPGSLVVLSGEEHQYALSVLVREGFYQTSPAILEERLADFTRIYEDSCKNSFLNLGRQYKWLQYMVGELKKAKDYFTTVVNPKMRNDFVLTLAPELQELIVYPSTQDPVAHQLLPMLSWNKSIRRYQDTAPFIAEYEAADKGERKKILSETLGNLLFSNFQNVQVNNWLYSAHKKECIDMGVSFKEI